MVDQNLSNYNILVSAQPFSNMNIDPEISHKTKSMVKTYLDILSFSPPKIKVTLRLLGGIDRRS